MGRRKDQALADLFGRIEPIVRPHVRAGVVQDRDARACGADPDALGHPDRDRDGDDERRDRLRVVRRHVARCPVCAAELERQRAVSSALSDLKGSGPQPSRHEPSALRRATLAAPSSLVRSEIVAQWSTTANLCGIVMRRPSTLPINVNARIVLCGSISKSDAATPQPGPANYSNLVARRARMEGFTGLDYPARVPEAIEALHRWNADGSLVHKEDIAYGLENAPNALLRLFAGENFGKQLVKVADAPA